MKKTIIIILAIIVCCIASNFAHGQCYQQCIYVQVTPDQISGGEIDGASAYLLIKLNQDTIEYEIDDQTGAKKLIDCFDIADTIDILTFDYWDKYGGSANGDVFHEKYYPDTIEITQIRQVIKYDTIIHYYAPQYEIDCDNIGEDNLCRGFPNAFSPNGDGVNDTFFSTLNEKFFVYDRWGSKVFAGTEWSGLGFAKGVYVIQLARKEARCEPFGIHLIK